MKKHLAFVEWLWKFRNCSCSLYWFFFSFLQSWKLKGVQTLEFKKCEFKILSRWICCILFHIPTAPVHNAFLCQHSESWDLFIYVLYINSIYFRLTLWKWRERLWSTTQFIITSEPVQVLWRHYVWIESPEVVGSNYKNTVGRRREMTPTQMTIFTRRQWGAAEALAGSGSVTQLGQTDGSHFGEKLWFYDILTLPTHNISS